MVVVMALSSSVNGGEAWWTYRTRAFEMGEGDATTPLFEFVVHARHPTRARLMAQRKVFERLAERAEWFGGARAPMQVYFTYTTSEEKTE